MTTTATLGSMIIVAESGGHRPAIITKVFANDSAEACMFAPLPEHIKVVKIHADQREAVNASLRGAAYHAYWPGKG